MNKLAELRKKDIYQSNPFLEMQKSFKDVLELRIFFLAQTDVRPHLPGVKDEGRWDKEFRTFRMPAAQVVELFTTDGTTRKNLYQRLKGACEGMIGSYVKQENPNKPNDFAFYTVFSTIKFNAEAGLTVCFSEEMRPYLLELQNVKYARLKLENSLALSSTYAINLLNYLLEYSFHGKRHGGKFWREVELDELRFVLNVPKDAYQGRMDRFRNRVLDNPIKEINDKLPYRITYTPIKNGRKVSGFRFDVVVLNYEQKLEQLPAASSKSSDDDAKVLSAFDEREVALIKRMNRLTTNETLSLKSAARLMKKYGYDRVHDNFEKKQKECCEAAKPLTAALVSAACRDDYAAQDREAQEAKKREKERERAKEHDRRQAKAGIIGGETILRQQREAQETQSVGDIVKAIMPPADAKASAAYDEMINAIKVPESAKDTWLRKCVAVSIDNGVLKLAAPNDFIKNWMRSKYLQALVGASADVDSITITTV